MSNPFATPTVPNGRYFVANDECALVSGNPGKPLGIVLNPEIKQAWYLEPASSDIGSTFHILRTDTGNYYLGTVTPIPPVEVGLPLFPIKATVTADKAAAWVFTLEGEYKDDQFKGKLISGFGIWKFGIQPPEEHMMGATGTPIISPVPEVNQSTWTLTLDLTGNNM